VLVASRGNNGTSVARYPGSYDDPYVITVGASGTDGAYKNPFNGDYWWSSSYGGNLDSIAPGTTDIVKTTVYPFVDNDIDAGGNNCTPGQELYNCFNGTSAAAPHVAGVVGLMLSKHNIAAGYQNNLAPEDVEYLLQQYAKDVSGTKPSGTYPVGYDEKNGHGLLDAGETLSKISGAYRVFHSGAPSTTSQSTFANQQIILAQNINGIAAGNYIASRVQVIHTYLDVFSPTTQVLAGWGRPSGLIGVGAANPVTGETFGNYQITTTSNVASVVVTTNCWYISHNISGQSINTWIPAHPSQVTTPYSLHLFDQSLVDIAEIENSIGLSAFPNPAKDQVQFTYSGKDVWKNASLQVYNSTGQLVEDLLWEYSSSPLLVNTQGYGSGVYFCRFRKDDKESTIRIFVE
jgi:hypothetical protein